MQPLSLIGYWIEALDDDRFPPPQELVTEWDASSKMKVINYLNSGRVLSRFRGITWCRFLCDRPMGGRELTDGKWAWPEDLSHYVQDHDVQLPEEFVASACRGGPVCHGPVNVLRRTDATYWIAWATKHRSNSLRSRIQAAREKASMKSKRLEEFAVRQLERSTRISPKQCREGNCANQALSRCGYCVNCYIELELSWRFRGPFEKLKPVLSAS